MARRITPSDAGLILEGGPEVREVEQRQVLVVAVAEDQREDRGLGVVEVEDLAQEQGTKRRDAGAHVSAGLARQRHDLGRMARGLERPCQRGVAGGDVGDRRVAGCADAREVALDVDREHRDPERRQLARHELERLRLARAGRSRDQAVAVDPGERHLDADVGQHVVAEHG